MSTETSDVIVVGGGPAGVAAAVTLRKAGVRRVTLLEREDYLGGATRHCAHSPFGMLEFGRVYFGESYGKRLETEALRAGVDVRYRHSVVALGHEGELSLATPDGEVRLTASRVVMATGIRETPRSARLISGDRPIGVVTTGAMQAYAAFHSIMPFKRPLIVGSELVTMSAILTCLSHGARPVAVIEGTAAPIVGAPFNWLPALIGLPFHRNARVVDLIGRKRVEAAKVLIDGEVRTIACDGVLFTGQFTPEASLFRQSGFDLQDGSGGPAIDQFGRCANPLYFAAGNLLRPVETAGWSFREGRTIGRAVAADLAAGVSREEPVRVTCDEPIKLVVPNLLRGDTLPGGLKEFQLRVTRRCSGTIALKRGSTTLWQRRETWLPERRIRVPRPAGLYPVSDIHFVFEAD